MPQYDRTRKITRGDVFESIREVRAWKPPERKAGRPSKKDHQLQKTTMYFSPEDVDALTRFAEHFGTSKSIAVRSLIRLICA